MKLFSKNNDDDLLLEQPQNNTPLSDEKKPTPTHRITAEEVMGTAKPNVTARYDGKSALESLKKRMLSNGDEVAHTAPTVKEEQPVPAADNEVKEQPKNEEPKVELKKEPQKSLLEKCRPFITDENGKDAFIPAVPLYKLESVAEILESNRKKSMDRLAEQYNLTVVDLEKSKANKENSQKNEPKPIIKETETQPDNDVIEINAIFQNVQSSVPFSVTEVETPTMSEPQEEPAPEDIGGTITFTPVTDDSEDKARIVVTSNTQNIDLTGEFIPVNEPQNPIAQQIELEKNEFDDFVPEDEIKDSADIKKYIRKFSITKRRSFLVCTFSFLLSLALGFMKLPFMSGPVLGDTRPTMIVCTAFTFIIIILNADMFLSLPKAFSQKSVADIAPAIASLFVLAYAVMGIITGEITLDILLLFGITLSLRALGKFRRDSYMLSNLRQISSNNTKNAVKLIDDKAVTFAMAKNSIEGDTLIAAPQKCNHISDFLKYATFGTFLNGKMPIITILSLTLSLISGFAAAHYFDGVIYGLYAAAAVQCFAALPTLFFIKDFPLYSAAKKLNRKGCMIAGQMAATHLELANAIMLNSVDIFPSGTVTLHQMKVLSENNLDQTILRAASLTECLNSPLAPIFKKIAGQSNITTFPNSDTIKYEEQLGISGWVDDELLFIGNRSHMAAHGIQVPDIEVDHKILRNGYFPVYVASADKVCALLVVQYSVDPEIAHELRRLTKIGVTLLVNNTDPNITNVMITDYFGLYEDSAMIMTNAGYHMYKNSTTPRENCSAPASFRFGNMSIARIMNCANRIKRSNMLLTALYVISAVLGIMIFAYSSFAGSGALISSSTVLLYSLICTVVSYALYLIDKP